MADRWQVDLFLQKFKEAWPPGCYVVPRDKNNQALVDLGLTPMQRRHEILALTGENYVEGPMPDPEEPSQTVWVFGTKIGGHEVYIKLTLKQLEQAFLAKCLSFHAAEHALSYPLGQKK